MITVKRIYDVPTLMGWRREVIQDVFGQEPTEDLLKANRSYYIRNIPEGSHIALVASYGEDEAGCGALCLSEELPSPDNASGRNAYLMNIYVREPFRCKGIGHFIVKSLVEIAREKGCGKIYLETTDEGRPVYSSLGFCDMEGFMKLSNLETHGSDI